MSKLDIAISFLGLSLNFLACQILHKKSFSFPSLANLKKQKKILIVIDSAVEDCRLFVQGIKPEAEVFVLNSCEDGVEQIARILTNYKAIDSLQIIAHGAEGSIKLGSAELHIKNIENYSNLLQGWKTSLNDRADILLVACSVAGGESGAKFIQKISQLTGANIAASQHPIGSSEKGGTWNLEFTLGSIESSLGFNQTALEAYRFVLATLVDETFQESAIFGPWIYGVSGSSAAPGLTAGSGSGILPGLATGDVAGNGALRLTSNATNQAAFVLYNTPISATLGLEVTFDFFAYNGSGSAGGEGVSFFLIDGSVTPTQAGGFGSSLGYARNIDGAGTPGIQGGYVGIGFDEYGNFARAFQKGPPGPDPTPIAGVNGYAAEPAAEVPDTVTIRGRENSADPGTGYNYITQTSVVAQGGIDNYTATTRGSAKKSVLVKLEPSPSNRLSVFIDFNNNGIYTDANETVIDIPNITTINGAVPQTFKFGFASSTGSATNIHEVQRLVVNSINPPPTEADVVTTKIGPAFVTPGGNIAYTITATNTSLTTDATNVLIQDQLPAGLTFVSAPEGGTFNTTTGVVSWPAITLPANQSVSYTLNVIAPDTGGPFTNRVFSSATTFDPTPANNNGKSASAQVTTEITPAVADVVTGKTGPATITAGTPITYAITTQNNGPSDATNVVITDTLPIGLTGVTVSDGGSYDAATGKVTFPAIATLNSGAANAVTRTIGFTVPPTLSSIVNTVTSSSDTPDPTPGNNDGTTEGSATTPGGKITTTIAPSVADVVTGKTGPASVTVGAPITYTLTTQNKGPSVATNVAIIDNLPVGLTGVTVSDGGSYDAVTGKVTFPAIATLNSGATNAVTRTISFTVPPTLNSIVNTVTSTSSTPDPTPGNNNGTTEGSATTPGGKITTIVNPSADVVTTKAGVTAAIAGTPVTYTITTKNNGPSAAANVIITDTLPKGLSGVTTSDGGSYDPVTGVLTFPSIDSLPSGSSLTRTFTVTVPASGSISNTAKSTSTTPDPNPSNNDGTALNATVTTSSTLPPIGTPTPTETPTPIPTSPGTPAVTIVQLLGTNDVLESLGSDVYKVRLNSQPTANVNVVLQGDSQISLDRNNLTFTPTNWNINQTVTVKAINDAVIQGDRVSTISHTTNSTDPLYNNLAKYITINIYDNDNLGLVQTLSQRSILGLTDKDDSITGSGLNDIIQSRFGNDYIDGQGGDDYLNGQKGADGIRGGDGNELIVGGQRFDFLQGDGGDDWIYGGKDKDRIFGNEGNDLLFGDAGHDYLSGDRGTDTLTGGEGNDVFAIAINNTESSLASADIITDFTPDVDKLDLVTPLTFSQLKFSQGTGVNINDTIIQYQPTSQYLAVLKGVKSNSLILELTL